MNCFELYPDAPIVPDCSLGGLRLRTSISEIQDTIMELYSKYLVSNKKTFSLPTPFEARYEFGEGEVIAWTDIRNGKIFKLTACSGYSGTLFGTIHVGMKIKDAMIIEPNLYYDDILEVVACKGCPGLAIDLPEADPPSVLVPQMEIKAINVYAAEALTPTGNKGIW